MCSQNRVLSVLSFDLRSFGHFGHKEVWFLHSSLDVGMFLRRSPVFIIIEKKINKSLSQTVM